MRQHNYYLTASDSDPHPLEQLVLYSQTGPLDTERWAPLCLGDPVIPGTVEVVKNGLVVGVEIDGVVQDGGPDEVWAEVRHKQGLVLLNREQFANTNFRDTIILRWWTP